LSKKAIMAFTGLLRFQFFGGFLEDANKFAPDELPLFFRIRHPTEQFEEALSGVDILQANMEISSKDPLHGFGFARAKQAIVDKNAGQLVTNCTMNKRRRNRGINAAGEAQDHFVVANFSPDFAAGLLDKRAHRPIGGTTAGFVEKVFNNVFAQRGVCDLRMKLQPEQ
jgi:hypothetical protein